MAIHITENPVSEIWIPRIRPTSTPLQVTDRPLTSADAFNTVCRIADAQAANSVQTAYQTPVHRLPAVDIFVALYNALYNAAAVEYMGIMYSAAWISTASVVSDYYQMSICLEHENPSQSTTIHVHFNPYAQHTADCIANGTIVTSAGSITLY